MGSMKKNKELEKQKQKDTIEKSQKPPTSSLR